VSDFTKLGKVLVTRSLVLSFLTSGICILVMLPLFSVAIGASEAGAGQIKNLIQMLVEIVPENPVQPFLDGNTLQIIFLAVIIGVILLVTGSRSENFQAFILDFNTVIMQSIELICRLLPIYIFASLTLQFWENGFASMLALWKPIAVCVAFCAVCMIAKLIIAGVKLKTPAGLLARKIMPGSLVGFATASSSSAFAACSRANEKSLGIDPKLSRIGLPVGNVLYQSFYVSLFIVTVYFCAEKYGVPVNVAWLLVAWIVCTLLSIAAPPVPGGTLACMSIILAQLGIPAEALPMTLTINVLLDFVCTGGKIWMLQLELALQADRLELLDYDILRRR